MRLVGCTHHRTPALLLLTASALLSLGATGPGDLAAAGCKPTPIPLSPAAPVPDSFLSKVTVGYQGWFSAPGDGSPINEWVHWAPGVSPAPGKISFEIYPDVSEYAPADLFATSLGVLGNGQPSRLFSSHSASVVDTHFRWMAENGIDGAGLQRFVVTLYDWRHLAFRNTVTQHVRQAAEKHGRLFYVEYDISGADPTTWVQDIENDWTKVMLGQLKITSSQQYAYQGGKPVVMLWGFGFKDRPGTPDQVKEIVQWFKAQGCFVGGGVPYEWREEKGSAKVGYLDAYAELDLLQPWAVGAVATDQEVQSHFASIVAQDRSWCSQRSIAYQRVIFPGFAWSNWNGGAKNMIPRRGGQFLWQQAYALRTANMPGAFVAMFDEYDEGTAIAKAAVDASLIPNSQYFLTLDADGTKVSSDFYLRLVGEATRMVKGERTAVATVPIPYVVVSTPPAVDPVPKQQAATPGSVHGFTAAQATTVVNRLYDAILGRAADPSGHAAYDGQVQSGALRTVASALMTSTEFDQRRPVLTCSTLADSLYQAILDRSADAGGLTVTADAIRNAKGADRLVDMVLSPEYATNNP